MYLEQLIAHQPLISMYRYYANDRNTEYLKVSVVRQLSKYEVSPSTLTNNAEKFYTGNYYNNTGKALVIFFVVYLVVVFLVDLYHHPPFFIERQQIRLMYSYHNNSNTTLWIVAHSLAVALQAFVK